MKSAAPPLRVGVLGAGRWGANILRTLLSLPEWRIARVARARSGPVDGLPSHAEVCTDWRRVAEADDLDAVIIATPPATHAEMMSAALHRRLAVFIEKPLTMNLAEAESLLDQARAHRGVVLVDHIHLFNPAFRAMKSALDRVGPIQAIETTAGGPGPARADCPVLWDWGPHDVAMVLDLLTRSPDHVAASREAKGPVPGAEAIALRLSFPPGIRVHIRVSNILREKQRDFRVTGARGVLHFTDGKPPRVTFRETAGTTEQDLPFSSDSSLTVALREFAAAIRAGPPQLASLEQAVDVTRILAAAQSALP